MKSLLPVITLALTAINAINATKILPPIWHDEFEPETSEPVKFVVTLPAYYRASKPFTFGLVLFESAEYTLPVRFTATLKNGGTKVASQEFTQTEYGLQQYVFTNMHNVISTVSRPSVLIEFNNENLQRYGQMKSRPNQLSEQFVFIQTDKAMYKPTQTVRFRVLALDRELKALSARLNITISDAKRNKIGIWLNKELKNGVFDGAFILSDFVHFGDWAISVNSRELPSTKQSFTVQQYVLPKYEAKIEFPKNYLLYAKDDSNYVGHVRAKYTFGKPLRGKGVVSLIQSCNYRRPSKWGHRGRRLREETPKVVFQKSVSLSGNGSVDDGKIVLNGLNKYLFSSPNQLKMKMDRSSCQLVFKVNVTEELTGTVVSSQETPYTLYRDAFVVKVHESVPKIIKPGMSFPMRIQVTQPDGSPIAEPVDVVTYYKTSSSKIHCYGLLPEKVPPEQYKIIKTDQSGILTVYINMQKGMESLAFSAFVREAPDAKICETRNVPSSRSKQAVSISLDRPFEKQNSLPRVGEKLTMKIKTTFASKYVYFLMSQNGESFIYKKLVDATSKTSSGSEYSVDVTLPEEAAPRCAAVAWTVENNKHEVLADALEFKVDGLVRQNVTAEFTPKTVKPGGPTELKIRTTEPGATVAMFAVDKSVKLLRSGNDITVDDVLGTVSTKTTNNYRPVGPVMWRCWRCGWWPSWVDSSSADQVFRGVGMAIESNAHTQNRRRKNIEWMQMSSNALLGQVVPMGRPRRPFRRMKSTHARKGSKAPSKNSENEQEGPAVRMLFPETWLWDNINSSSTGEVVKSLHAPDTITSWVLSAFAVGEKNGFGALEQPVELTVFKPFFVSLNIPYATVIRGEQFAIKAVVFNYESEAQVIKMTLKQSDLFEISTDGGDTYASQELSTTVNVKANDGESISLWLKPKILGEIKLQLEGTSLSGDNASSQDAILKKILVEPEGEPRYVNRPLFIRRESSAAEPTPFVIDVKDMFGSKTDLHVVDGSKMFQLQSIGDLLGPALTQLGAQIRLPTGCGEQTMIILAPNVYIYKYLKSVNALSQELATKTTDFVLQGYQRELTYQHKDGGFSAFGNNDPSSSTWLTAFVMRCFNAAVKHVGTEIDESIVKKAWRFLKTNANDDGTFEEPGRVIHSDMKGGSNSDANLAAYIYTTFAEAGGDSELAWDSLTTTRSMLISKMTDETTTKPYQLAIIAYAMSILPEDRSISKPAIDRILSIATRDADLIYWKFEGGHHSQSQVETAAYVLLALCKHDRLEEATAVARWLMSQRNSLGGFSSTQDTVVGLQALSEFASKISGVGIDLKIAATLNFAQHPPFVKEFAMTPSNAMLLQSFDVPRNMQSLKTVSIRVTGTGVGMVQLALRYNVAEQELTDSGDFKISVTEQTAFRQKRSVSSVGNDDVSLSTCIQPQTAQVKKGMVVAELGIPTGFESDLNEVKGLNEISPRVALKRIEMTDRNLVFYFDQTEETTCVQSKFTRKSQVRNAQKPLARVYSYYEPSRAQSALYSFAGLSEDVVASEPVERPKVVEQPVEKPATLDFSGSLFYLLLLISNNV